MAEQDYKSTLKLPRTDFPMKADLPRREPGQLARWEGEGIYRKILEGRKSAPLFSLHDGPPYANGSIHNGHVLNKILKDLVVKYKTMAGFRVDYIPGWDCHGLPIERALEEELGREKKHSMSAVEFRQACRAYAGRFVGVQRDEFKRLGVFGRWEEPYQTMAPGYEAIIAREFGRFVGNGGAYKGKKPVHWCWNDQTALAEAEVEYARHQSPSVWVKFPLPAEELPPAPRKALGNRRCSVVIWTTTPWTLPANLAIAFNPTFEYVLVEPASARGEAWLIARGLVEKFTAETGIGGADVLTHVDPKALERKAARHPLLDRKSLLVLGDYVTLEAGTGCVHTAPGHGADDFATGQRYGLETLAPVDDSGRFTKEAGAYAGEQVFKANPRIVADLAAAGALVHQAPLEHEYPHCWRCKKPVIFRATTQWFISMERNDLRKDALSCIEKTRWIPSWGRERIYGMVESRPDWCISRQRTWGVPIVAFKCSACQESHTSQAIVERVAKVFEKEGSDAWYARSAAELIGEEACPKCGKRAWKQEADILDVWFESGVSYAAVCEPNPALGFPVDLYLEGSDQHRGWFQSTLLASVGTRGKNAFRSCLTHGWVVDEKGEKLSKSKKNYVELSQVLSQSGADLLRLWVASSEYREDIRLSQVILQRVGEAYRDVRNNFAKAILGNLFDFDPDRDRVPVAKLPEIDRFMLHRLATLVERLETAYREYEFHSVYHAAVTFCRVDLSSFYVDVLKDRLYCGLPGERRPAQTVLFEILSSLTRMLAPVLAFTCEEIWSAMPAWKGKEASVHLTRFPQPPAEWKDQTLATRWERVLSVRELVLKKLEELRASKGGKSDDALVSLGASGDLEGFLVSVQPLLGEAFSVSEVRVVADPAAGETPSVRVEPAAGTRCPRCRRWYRRMAGEVCERCAEAIRAWG